MVKFSDVLIVFQCWLLGYSGQDMEPKHLESASPITMPYDNYLRYLFSGKNTAFSIQPPIIRFSGVESDIAARNENIRRSARNRSKLYFYRKQRRTIIDKISATKGYFKWILKTN